MPECLSEAAAVNRGLRADPDAKAAKDLGQDNARVATRAHQGTMSGALRHRGEIRIVQLTNILDRRLQREEHVGAGIAVRYRKDVEGVDLVPVQRQPGQRSEKGFSEQAAVALGDRHGRGVSQRRQGQPPEAPA